MVTVNRDINCGQLYAFVCESKIEDNKEYLEGKESRFLGMDITIRQSGKKEPYLIIYDNEDKEIGALWAEGGYIYINGQQYRAILNKIDDTFVLEVNLFDDADTMYHKNRKRKEFLEELNEKM